MAQRLAIQAARLTKRFERKTDKMISEYVSIGHPDKIADYISEYILDRYLEKDPSTRYALEVQVKDNFVSLAGEVTSLVDFTPEDFKRMVVEAVKEIGYTEEYADKWGEGNCIDPRRIEVAQHISQQSPDIAQGVDREGWGDQGIFWGMAVNNPDTNYMPVDHWFARQIGDALFNSGIGGLDIKTEVTMVDGLVESVIVAIPLLETGKEYEAKVAEVVEIVQNIVGDCEDITVNGTGKYVCHSSQGDAGTTGRKLAVDFYGGNCRIGGGSPWTKDPTKADLTLNLYARKKALDYLMRHGLEECHVQIGCCIGQRDITIQYYDGNMNLLATQYENKGTYEIIRDLGLDKPIYTSLVRKGLPNYIVG